MRLKTFTAPSMGEAMAQVKLHFGPDAIIVSTRTDDDGVGVRITAAHDHRDSDQDYPAPEPQAQSGRDPLDIISEALAYHNVPADLADRLVDAAAESPGDKAMLKLTVAVNRVFKFDGADRQQPLTPQLMVGLPGAGKTVAVAKLATDVVVNHQALTVITTDSIRAGGYEQLAAFTNILDLDLLRADDPDSLKAAVIAAGQGKCLIDSAGANPFDSQQFERQHRLIQAIDCAPCLVMAAGGDTGEAAEMAEAFAAMGAVRLIATRLDIARRIGAILVAADTGNLILDGFSATANVASPPQRFNAISLARILLPQNESELSQESPSWATINSQNAVA
ncbi:GTP-binding protein [Alphaproteobacteria bacterium]|nr:GTP-binding protein [Alphaproteobacteria bacterium]